VTGQQAWDGGRDDHPDQEDTRRRKDERHGLGDEHQRVPN
jgi:hypothetical protein